MLSAAVISVGREITDLPKNMLIKQKGANDVMTFEAAVKDGKEDLISDKEGVAAGLRGTRCADPCFDYFIESSPRHFK